MTLWQASLHTCQLVGDIYPLINAPTLIGISASLFFILFLLLHTLQDIKLFLFFSDRLLFSLWATGCSGRTGRFSGLVVAKGWVFKSWHFLKQEGWRSFFFFFFPRQPLGSYFAIWGSSEATQYFIQETPERSLNEFFFPPVDSNPLRCS